MAEAPQDALVLDVSRDVVTALAPGELEVFDAVGDAYLDETAGGKNGEEMLGFGVEAVAFLTPFVVVATKAVVSYLSGIVSKAVKDESESVVVGYVKRLFRRFTDDDGPPGQAGPVTLSAEEVQAARTVAFEKAREAGLPPKKADLLADAIAGGLVTHE